jgi:hypothetical protein
VSAEFFDNYVVVTSNCLCNLNHPPLSPRIVNLLAPPQQISEIGLSVTSFLSLAQSKNRRRTDI